MANNQCALHTHAHGFDPICMSQVNARILQQNGKTFCTGNDAFARSGQQTYRRHNWNTEFQTCHAQDVKAITLHSSYPLHRYRHLNSCHGCNGSRCCSHMYSEAAIARRFTSTQVAPAAAAQLLSPLQLLSQRPSACQQPSEKQDRTPRQCQVSSLLHA